MKDVILHDHLAETCSWEIGDRGRPQDELNARLKIHITGLLLLGDQLSRCQKVAERVLRLNFARKALMKIRAFKSQTKTLIYALASSLNPSLNLT